MSIDNLYNDHILLPPQFQKMLEGWQKDFLKNPYSSLFWGFLEKFAIKEILDTYAVLKILSKVLILFYSILTAPEMMQELESVSFNCANTFL